VTQAHGPERDAFRSRNTASLGNGAPRGIAENSGDCNLGGDKIILLLDVIDHSILLGLRIPGLTVWESYAKNEDNRPLLQRIGAAET
jgi:hypothetical protein